MQWPHRQSESWPPISSESNRQRAVDGPNDIHSNQLAADSFGDRSCRLRVSHWRRRAACSARSSVQRDDSSHWLASPESSAVLPIATLCATHRYLHQHNHPQSPLSAHRLRRSTDTVCCVSVAEVNHLQLLPALRLFPSCDSTCSPSAPVAPTLTDEAQRC